MKPVYKVVSALGCVVKVLSVKGGWSTVKFLIDKKEGKVRNTQLRDLTEAELRKFDGKIKEADLNLSPADKMVNPDHSKYVRHKIKSPSGRPAFDINDKAADLLRGQDISDCYFIVAKNIAAKDGSDVDSLESELKSAYRHLNVGMQRMNLGNRLRKVLGTYGNLNAHKGGKEQKHDDKPRLSRKEKQAEAAELRRRKSDWTRKQDFRPAA